MSLPQEGKVAIVTGSSRGIGKAIALKLASDGADIVVCARNETSTPEFPGSIAETTAAVRALGRKALPVRVDVTNDDDLSALVKQTVETFGRIDILVNNAVFLVRASYEESDVALLDASFRTNIRAPYYLSRLVVPELARQGGGAIVNISSGAANVVRPLTTEHWGKNAKPISGVYGITKAALDRFSKGLALDVYDYRIGVITVYPGWTLTEMETRNAQPDADLSRAEPLEVPAKAVAFLCRSPMEYTGRFLTAREVVATNNL